MDFPKLIKTLLKFHSNLFNNKSSYLDKKYNLKRLKIRGTGKSLRYYSFGDYMLIEQNPYKNTKDAKKARDGEKISWLIDTTNDKYLYKIIDIKIKRL